MICGLFLLKTRRFPILSSSGRRFTSIHHIKKEEEDTCLRPSVIPQKAGRMLRICRILRTNRKHPSCLCDPAGIQTQDLQNRNLTLYSAKLPGQCGCKITEKERIPKEKCGKTHTQALRNGVFEGIRRWRSAPHRRFICRKNEDRCIKHSQRYVFSTFYLYLCRRLCPCTPAWVSTKNT